MDQSPGSAGRRAHLIREMARYSDRGHTRASNLSSNASADGDNDKHEDNSLQWDRIRLNQDYQLNSSAIRRAFPEFSQGSSSDEDSIEVGRGPRKSTKDGHETLQSEDLTEDMPFTFGNGDKYRITATPPIKPRSTNIKTTAAVRSKKSEKIEPPQSGENKENEGYGMQNPVDKNATVESIDSNLVLETDSVKQYKPSHEIKSGTRKSKLRGDSEQLVPNGTNTSILSAANGTYQSLVLPDMPNITELISGVRQDGTPLFTRSSKTRSRFITPSQVKRSGNSRHAHIPVADVPAETDDKALYVALQLLQEKVKVLETEKAESERKLEDYELEVLQLKSKLDELEHKRNSDSGIGTDLDEGQLNVARDEKSRLESSIKTLQDRLDRANRKVAKNDITIQSLHKDRDAAQQQLATAFLNSEDLKNESQAMRDEIVNIKGQITRLNRNHEKQIDQLMKQEAELRGKIDRREKAINEMSSLIKELWQTRKALAAGEGRQAAVEQHQDQPQHIHRTKNRRSSQGSQSRLIPSNNDAAVSQSQSRIVSKGTATTGDTTRVHRASTARQTSIPNTDHDFITDNESTTDIQVKGVTPMVEELSRNSTYMSFMEGDEVNKLRNIVDEDKRKLAKSHDKGHVNPSTSHTVNQTLPRKSSLKKVSYNIDPQHVLEDDISIDKVTTSTRNLDDSRRHPQQPFPSQGSENRRRSVISERADFTSAFILPDITLDAQQLVGEAPKQRISIPRPVPVSERQLDSSKSEEDLTIRPAQPPALALATVLKSLEDDLEQLRAEVAKQETLYNQHDPALSKRKRKIVYARIQKLLAAMELRSDQIYALYDVLEGQKASGQVMEEEEVEVTLQNIGIEDDLLARNGFYSNKRNANLQQQDRQMEEDISVAEDDEDELPFEGFDTTQTQTLDSIRRFGGR